MTFPPSVPVEHSFNSSTYESEVPLCIQQNPEEPVVLGVDEAGRGPVLGPMVYGIAYCLKTFETELKSKYKFADSKTLNELKRTELLQSICESESELNLNVGWNTRTMTAMDISSGMLRPNSIGNYNLNEQAHDATMDLIQLVLDKGVNLKEVFVDTVGPPTSYQLKLQKRFPTLKITVAKKADALYPCVSAASICAKVTRDFSLNSSKEQLYSREIEWGSGYPSDPKTSKWLNTSVDPIFGWNQIVRFSWQTAKDAIKNNDGVEIEWEEDNVKTEFSLDKMLNRNELPVSTKWYGHSVDIF